MKYLLDTEILRWNERLDGSNIMVYPVSNTRSSEPDILYKQLYKSHNLNNFVQIPEPFINFTFSFSISSSREKEFFKIFDILIKEKFGTKSIYSNKHEYGAGFIQDEKATDISFSESVVENKSSLLHKVKEKEYVRWTYNFSGKLGHIMAYVSYLEDTIEFFSKIWGYDEQGNEYCLVKFSLGSVVSPLTDKSKDLLVIDYKYTNLFGKFYIDYQASEMKMKGNVIIYGNPKTYKEDELCFSRNQRIDDILN